MRFGYFRIGIAALFMLAAPVAPVTAQEAPGAPTYAAVVDRAISGYVVAAYERLQATTHDLVSHTEDFCLAPGDETKAALAEGFAATVAVWAGVDFFRFGPMAVDARYERFAFWPDRHGTAARQLRRFLADEDPALLEPGALEKQSAAVQGLPALESLLHTGSKALMSAEILSEFRCNLAMAIAGNMDRIASQALADWTGAAGWATLMRAPGNDNPVYRTDQEAMTEFLKAILTGLEQMRDHRLSPALGATLDEARATRAPYKRSGEALPYLSASADALEAFVAASGIMALLPEDEGWMANSVAFEFSNLKNALADAGPDLEAALADTQKYQKLKYAEIVLTSLRDIFQRRFAPVVGLTQGFNALDGD